MPQGPTHLHEKFGDDGTAWYYLESRGFTETRFLIEPPAKGYKLNDEEIDAINYLCLEWDWAYDG